MGQQSTLKSIVTSQLRGRGIELTDLLDQYPRRSFVDLQKEIEVRTGVSLSARTLRRWASTNGKQEPLRKETP